MPGIGAATQSTTRPSTRGYAQLRSPRPQTLAAQAFPGEDGACPGPRLQPRLGLRCHIRSPSQDPARSSASAPRPTGSGSRTPSTARGRRW